MTAKAPSPPAPAADRLREGRSSDAASLQKSTQSGLPLRPVYRAADRASANPEADPGQYPFTRGPHETMYRGKPWTMRMFAGFGTPEDTNARFRYLLSQGQTGLSTAFDMPTLMGYDSDHPLCRGEVGREGVAVSTVEDMDRLFADIPLDRVSTSMTINAPAVVALAFYAAVAERRGVSSDALAGTIQNDMLKEFIAQKEWICPLRPHLRIVSDMLVHCTRHMPRWNTISISGYHIREAGATAVQELAFTLANGIAYVELGIAAGLDVDAFAPRLSFFWDIHNDFFEEIAKLRAARRMWAKLMRERFGARDPRSLRLRAHSQTAGVTLTAQQPLNNSVRVTLQALAAVLGGTQSLHTNSYDETYALPTEEAATLALRTQQIIAEESGVADVADPLGGSYFVEALTDEMEAAAQKYLSEIERRGGMVAATEAGYPQREIAQAAYQQQLDIECGRRTVVGVNKHQNSRESASPPTLKIGDAAERNQLERLRAYRAQRSAAAVARGLDGVRRACEGKENVMANVLEAVKLQVTLGEVCDVLRDVYGVYKDPGHL